MSRKLIKITIGVKVIDIPEMTPEGFSTMIARHVRTWGRHE